MLNEDKLININLKIEQNKDELTIVKGFKLYLFEALYLIQQYHGLHKFWDILFTIFEFIQLMAFPMDKVFDKSWGNHWVKTFGSFFRYSNLFFLWKGTSFFIITYIITCIYIILFISLSLYALIKSTKFVSKPMIKAIVLMLEINIILNIPLLRTLFSIFSCEKNVLESSPEIKCQSGIHIFLVVLSAILIIIFQLLIFIFHSALYEFGVNNNKFKSGYTSSTEIFLDIIKLILIIIYQFISHQMALAIITLLLSIIILIHFLVNQPYSSGFTMKLYLILFALLCWSCVICIVSLLLKNSKFKSGIVLMILGYPLIIAVIYLTDWELYADIFFNFNLMNNNHLLKIQYFLRLEENFDSVVKTKEYKLLYSYIGDYETHCIEKECYLKQFLKIPLKKENFQNLKILLLHHAEKLYKESITKNSTDIKLRIAFILFLFKRLNKKMKGKKELILLDKFKMNLECSFLLFKVQKYFQENLNEEFNSNEIISLNLSNKLISNEIKVSIENIVSNYISFWNMLLIHDLNKFDIFIQISRIGKKLKSLNKELNDKIKSLDNWNLLEQETIKIYIQYLKVIINNYEKANIFSNKLSEEEKINEKYDEKNLFELNYKEMSKNEDYKYIIINCSKNNLNKICNISFPVCKIFGYTREELINNYLDILFPEIYNKYRKILFQKKLAIYKKELLTKTKKINSENWIDNCFGINKSNFLIFVKIKWFLISIEDDTIYAIGNLLHENKKIINDKSQEAVYILTDKKLIIQNFSPNAQKILKLNPSIASNNCSINEYIKELNEKLISELETRIEKEESNISIRKSPNPKRNTKNIKSEILKKNKYLENNCEKIIHWKTNEIIEKINLNVEKDNNKSNYQNTGTLTNKIQQRRQSFEFNFLDKNKIKKNRNTSPLINKGLNFSSIYNYEMDKNKYFSEIESNMKNKDNSVKYKELILKMIVKEAKYHENKVGYIFIFKPYIQKAEDDKNMNSNAWLKDLANTPENKNMDISDLSLISFGEEKNKLNNKQMLSGSFISTSQINDKFLQNFCFEKENQFTFDINNMTYKQFRYNSKKNSFFEELKNEAMKKLTNLNKKIQKEESEDEDEEEEEESEYTSKEDNSNNNSELEKGKKEKEEEEEKEEKLSIKSENNKKISEEIKKKSIADGGLREIKKINSLKNTNNEVFKPNPIDKMAEAIKKLAKEEFYHVNFTKIKLYVFNYTSGFVELQKGQNHKISQVTFVMNAEKERLKHSNSRYISSTKYFKGKKKGNINKKEEDELNTYSITSNKIKEIYRALLSKNSEKSVLNLFLYSIIIFILILGTGIMNVFIFSYLKNEIYSFFFLIQKTDNFYQNLLFEITLVKELLIINSSYYNNTLNKNKTMYYHQISRMIYHYFSENTFILSDISNNLNILNPEDELSITQKQVELYILDPLKSFDKYQYKSYRILVYSAYRELNSALYHISQLTMEEIYQYQDDVYYFLKNGMSNLLISSEDQMWTLTEKFKEKIKYGHRIIIICCVAILVVYIICFLIFFHFNKFVVKKKQNYLSIFKELDDDLIVESLQKCEKFIKQMLTKKNNKELNEVKKLSDSSYLNDSEKENDNFSLLIEKRNKGNDIIKSKNNKNENKKKSRYNHIFQIILFFLLFAIQVGAYIFYYERSIVYENIIIYEYFISMYASNFLYVFIGLREYIFDKKFKFYNQTVDEFVNNTLTNYYVIFSQSSKMKDTYRVYFPESYQEFLNYLYSSSQLCEFINAYIAQYPASSNADCDTFFVGSSKWGFFVVLTAFIEEIRALKIEIDSYISLGEKKNFKYNESYFNDPRGNYEELYKKYENNIEEYRNYNPANILNTISHKRLLVTYLYINTQVYSLLISQSLKQFEDLFEKYNSINFIIILLFLIVIVLGFFFIWIPFTYYQNKTFEKIKNMISIIPSDLLMNIPDINNLLGIEG